MARSSNLKTLTINQLIKGLNEIKTELKGQGVPKPGEVKVLMSTDEEGNSYSTLSFDGLYGYEPNSQYGKVVLLYPYEEGYDIY